MWQEGHPGSPVFGKAFLKQRICLGMRVPGRQVGEEHMPIFELLQARDQVIDVDMAALASPRHRDRIIDKGQLHHQQLRTTKIGDPIDHICRGVPGKGQEGHVLPSGDLKALAPGTGLRSAC